MKLRQANRIYKSTSYSSTILKRGEGRGYALIKSLRHSSFINKEYSLDRDLNSNIESVELDLSHDKIYTTPLYVQSARIINVSS